VRRDSVGLRSVVRSNQAAATGAGSLSNTSGDTDWAAGAGDFDLVAVAGVHSSGEGNRRCKPAAAE